MSEKEKKRNSLTWALLISIFLHVLFLILYALLRNTPMFQLIPEAELLAQQQQEDEKRIEFELVETPDDARSDEKPENTNLLSDKNSMARDMHAKDKPAGDPYSDGQTRYRTFASPFVPPSQPNMSPVQEQQSEKEDSKEVEPSLDDELSALALDQYPKSAKEFNREYLYGESQTQPQIDQSFGMDDATYKNTESVAEALGGVTLNTYDWPFAPYLLEMKRKIRDNVYPPAAFIRMGLISGKTVLRFKVMRNGEMRDLEVLNYTGHTSLKETSVIAVQNSAPFKPLPRDFPADYPYLELTWSFIYSISME